MASLVYNNGMYLIVTQALDLNSETDIRVLLLKTGYTPDKDHVYVSDLTPASYEVTVSGYSRGVLTTTTISKDDTNDRVKFTAANYAFGALSTGETVIAAVAYKYNVADSAAPLIAYADFTDTPTNGSTFTVNWHADGIFYIQM
jgi:hypothetical protein